MPGPSVVVAAMLLSRSRHHPLDAHLVGHQNCGAVRYTDRPRKASVWACEIMQRRKVRTAQRARAAAFS